MVLMLNTIKILTRKDPTFKVDDRVRISDYKNVFAKGYTQNWSDENFMITKIKDTVPWTYVVSDLRWWWTCYWKFLWKKPASQEKFRIEKVIKRKCDKFFFKWKVYNNRFNAVHLIIKLIKTTLYKNNSILS